MSKKRRSVINEIKKMDKSKIQKENISLYSNSYQLWQSEVSNLEKLVEQYPKGMEQWNTDFEEFIDTFELTISSNIKLIKNQLGLEDKEVNISFSLLTKVEKDMDDFCQSKNYSLRQIKILKTSYILYHAKGFCELTLEDKNLNFKEKELTQKNLKYLENLLMWSIAYRIFREDLIFESSEICSFSQTISDLIFQKHPLFANKPEPI